MNEGFLGLMKTAKMNTHHVSRHYVPLYAMEHDVTIDIMKAGFGLR